MIQPILPIQTYNVAKELGHHCVVFDQWVPNAVTCITRIDGTNIPSAGSDCKRRDTASSIVLGYGFSGRQRAKKNTWRHSTWQCENHLPIDYFQADASNMPRFKS